MMVTAQFFLPGFVTSVIMFVEGKEEVRVSVTEDRGFLLILAQIQHKALHTALCTLRYA